MVKKYYILKMEVKKENNIYIIKYTVNLKLLLKLIRLKLRSLQTLPLNKNKNGDNYGVRRDIVNYNT